jgi:hypothetical protein
MRDRYMGQVNRQYMDEKVGSKSGSRFTLYTALLSDPPTGRAMASGNPWCKRGGRLLVALERRRFAARARSNA